jgi:imidazole glycerol phosphate synthase glutamine amidotransferase subunit
LIRALDERNLRMPLIAAIRRGVPFLGICLGLQVLFESSEEAPQLRGLNLMLGRVSALPSNIKLPHMGWNQLAAKRESGLLAGVGPEDYFYFAHSYAALDSNGTASATCTHGAEFTAVIEEQNICAVQFHPEKSGEAGARVLQNFLRMAV